MKPTPGRARARNERCWSSRPGIIISIPASSERRRNRVSMFDRATPCRIEASMRCATTITRMPHLADWVTSRRNTDLNRASSLPLGEVEASRVFASSSRLGNSSITTTTRGQATVNSSILSHRSASRRSRRSRMSFSTPSNALACASRSSWPRATRGSPANGCNNRLETSDPTIRTHGMAANWPSSQYASADLPDRVAPARAM